MTLLVVRGVLPLFAYVAATVANFSAVISREHTIKEKKRNKRMNKLE